EDGQLAEGAILGTPIALAEIFGECGGGRFVAVLPISRVASAAIAGDGVEAAVEADDSADFHGCAAAGAFVIFSGGLFGAEALHRLVVAGRGEDGTIGRLGTVQLKFVGWGGSGIGEF